MVLAIRDPVDARRPCRSTRSSALLYRMRAGAPGRTRRHLRLPRANRVVAAMVAVQRRVDAAGMSEDHLASRPAHIVAYPGDQPVVHLSRSSRRGRTSSMRVAARQPFGICSGRDLRRAAASAAGRRRGPVQRVGGDVAVGEGRVGGRKLQVRDDKPGFLELRPRATPPPAASTTSESPTNSTDPGRWSRPRHR